MDIELNKPFASNANVKDYDVRQMKKALNRLGYYQPYAKTGVTGISDGGVFTALKAFQKDQGLPTTGTARPDDPTIKALNIAVQKQPEGRYIWRTVGDDTVRASHAALNGTIRSWDESPDPGEDYNCRCWAEPVEAEIVPDTPDAIYPVYPELLLIPLLRIGKLYSVWKIWTNKRDTEWTLGKHKSDTKWGNQLKNRDWTPQQITETIKNGKKFSAPNKVHPENEAVRYEYKGRYVVRDEVTKEILQVGHPDFVRSIFSGGK